MLEGEIAIITGSSCLGTGCEIARVFARGAARVVVTGRNVGNGELVASQIIAAGGDALFIPADLESPSDCRSLVKRTLDYWGGMSILVHSAIATEHGRHVSELGDAPLSSVPDDVWKRNMDINLESFRSLCQAALPVMQSANHGVIISIGSRAAERGTRDRAAYTASKGAMHALIRSIAVDYARDGIRANTVAAGF